MTDVRLLGPDGDGRSLVVATAEGERFSLPVTAELRALVTDVEAPSGERVPSLPPKEVQRRIRAGFTSEDLAALAGVSVESVRRYEAPVLAERAYIADLARATRVGRDPSSPILGELVADRLAGRGVAPAATAWDAWRTQGAPWRVAVSYPLAGRSVRAIWTFDHLARTVTAEDAEARWLTETDILDVPARPRHLASVGPDGEVRSPTPAGFSSPESEAPAPKRPTTDELLEELAAKRGVREEIPEPNEAEAAEEEFEGFGPLRAREAEVGFASGTSYRPVPRPAPADDSPNAAPPRSGAPRGRSRDGRAHVPRWDEIVFGARTDR